MSKSIVLIDNDILDEPSLLQIRFKADAVFELQPDGTWKKESATNPCKEIPIFRAQKTYPERPNSELDLVDIFMAIAELTGIDINNPNIINPICTCPTKCDCADPDNGLISMHCPIHNEYPTPDPDCVQHRL